MLSKAFVEVGIRLAQQLDYVVSLIAQYVVLDRKGKNVGVAVGVDVFYGQIESCLWQHAAFTRSVVNNCAVLREGYAVLFLMLLVVEAR